MRFPIPLGSGSAAIKIECGGAVFGICMAGEVGFGQGDHARNACFAGKFVPYGADSFETQIVNHSAEQIAQYKFVTKALRVAARSFDQPFRSYDHSIIYDAISEKVCTVGLRNYNSEVCRTKL